MAPKQAAAVAVLLAAACVAPQSRVDQIDLGSAAPPEEPFARYPTLEAPQRVTARQEFALAVSLTESLITAGVRVAEGGTADELAVDLSSLPASEKWTLDVVLAAPGFDLRNGRNFASIVLPNEGDSTRALFWITPQETGTATVEFLAYVYYGDPNFVVEREN